MFALLFCGISALGLSGCGIGSQPPISPPSKPLSVLFLGAPPTSMAVKSSATFSAGVVNGNGTSLVSWSVTCSSAGACGSFDTNPTLSSSPVTYTAPSNIPAGTTVTITATATEDTTKSISATVTIVPPIPIVVSFYAPMPASVEAGSTITLSAAIANDVSANPEVTWAVSCGGGSCGSFNPTSTTSEAQTMYTAPATVPAGGSVTITITSMTDTTKSASANVVITAPGPTLANGSYVFQLSGPSGLQSSFTTGVFVAKNGAVTGGEQDSIFYNNDSDNGASSDTQTQPITGGSYATAPSGALLISLNLGGATETLNGMVTAGSQGFVGQLYGSLGDGTLELQTSAAAPAGGYAVSTYGVDKFGQPASIGGVLNVDGAGGISGAGTELDVLDGASGQSGKATLAASTVSSPDAFGRVEFQLMPGTASVLQSLYLVGYVVDATHIRLLETAGDLFLGVQGGVALGQGSSTGKFGNSSLAGNSYVFGLSGEGQSGTLQVAGVLTADASGGVTGKLNWNEQTGKAAQAPIAFTGSYAIDANGRVTLSNLTDGNTFNYSLWLYAGAGGGLILSNDMNDQLAGEAFQQQAGGFSAASLSGSYGLNAAQGINSTQSTTASQGVVLGSFASVAGSGSNALTGYATLNNNPADFGFSGAFTAGSDGVFPGTFTGFSTAAPASVNSFTLYMVDSTRGLVIETDNTQLLLGNFQLMP
ncbi:hypothetical protein [Acidicapsa ligni]|uniref:hypothetical protein n=1 Tax=Acidicapsa ligni TaxID=542300 RepID=UPI0021E071B5|nr:hypothetical protein [Acidicapsa ligni]